MNVKSTTRRCHCKTCDALLAKLERDGLTIRRGSMQITVTGNSTVAVTCYRCRALNVLASPRTPTPTLTSPSERPTAPAA